MVERTDVAVQLATEELVKSKAELERTVNELRSLHDAIFTELARQIKEIRETRMAVVQEARSMLSALGDIRKFFLEENYNVEMARLDRMIKTCRDLQELQASGTLDAVGDVILKLALKPEVKP